ncbi:hypothetical protein JTB14_003198 [Gonioctena quinquepunctata]|nr:hypothetical protein JTB14_003198 [Gonioctena quinquepunctata]
MLQTGEMMKRHKKLDCVCLALAILSLLTEANLSQYAPLQCFHKSVSNAEPDLSALPPTEGVARQHVFAWNNLLDKSSIDDHAVRMLLPDETYEQNAMVAGHLLAMLRMYDDFLSHYRIRPEFFCRYKEKQALQKRLSRVLAETRPKRIGIKWNGNWKDIAEELYDEKVRIWNSKHSPIFYCHDQRSTSINSSELRNYTDLSDSQELVRTISDKNSRMTIFPPQDLNLPLNTLISQ